jgi:hypothetical protein
MEEDNNAHVLVSQSVSHMICSLPPSRSFLHLFIRLTSDVRARPTGQAATDDKQKQHAPWNHEENK